MTESCANLLAKTYMFRRKFDIKSIWQDKTSKFTPRFYELTSHEFLVTLTIKLVSFISFLFSIFY